MLANSTQKTEIHAQVKYLARIILFESAIKTDVLTEDTWHSGQTGAVN